MTPKEIKIFLLRNGFTVGGIAREMNARRDMVSQLFNQLRYYPTLAQRIERQYGISVPRPTASSAAKKVSKRRKPTRRAA